MPNKKRYIRKDQSTRKFEKSIDAILHSLELKRVNLLSLEIKIKPALTYNKVLEAFEELNLVKTTSRNNEDKNKTLHKDLAAIINEFELSRINSSDPEENIDPISSIEWNWGCFEE